MHSLLGLAVGLPIGPVHEHTEDAEQSGRERMRHRRRSVGVVGGSEYPSSWVGDGSQVAGSLKTERIESKGRISSFNENGRAKEPTLL